MNSISHNIDTILPHENGETLVQRFERHAQTQPEHIAIIDSDATSSTRSSGTRYSYRDLNARANTVAHAIVSTDNSSTENAAPVALLMNVGASLAAAILGTLKTGRVCVPLEVADPAERARLVMRDAGAQLLVTDNANLENARALTNGQLAGNVCEILNVDALSPIENGRNLDLLVDNHSAAYLIYTSGSTGQPKGVIETHRNVLHHADRYAGALDFGPADRIALLASCSVGQGMKTLCSALMSGATLCPFSLKTRGIDALSVWLIEEKITILISVPSVFRQLAQTVTSSTRSSTRSAFPSLRLIRLGGETLHQRDIELFRQNFSPRCQLVNSYSSTETGNVALFFTDDSALLSGETVPVGIVAADAEVSIVDENGQQIGADEIGEIVVRSAWLSPGYWRNDEQTKQVFSRGATSDEQIYRSGDLGSMSPEGLLSHRGRVDSQIKIRGFRVELGEIEAALQSLHAVREAVVVAQMDARGDNVLLAFIVADVVGEKIGEDTVGATSQSGKAVKKPEQARVIRNETARFSGASQRQDFSISLETTPISDDAKGSIDASALRGFLAAKLPAHAIPVFYERLETLPLTRNGKTDRAHLKTLAADAMRRNRAENVKPKNDTLRDDAPHDSEPRDDTEKRLAEIWMDILGLNRVGRHDDFFQLGGHSLLTVALAAQIEKTFACDVPHSAIFGSSVFGAATIAAQAAFLRREASGETSSAWPNIVVLQPRGTRPALFCVHDMNDSLWCYREFVRGLGSDQPVRGLRPPSSQISPNARTSSTRSCASNEQRDSDSDNRDGDSDGDGDNSDGDNSDSDNRDIENMAAIYVRDVCAFQPRGDLYVCGYSFGGTVAFEMARQLEGCGRNVAFLALIDTGCRADPLHAERRSRAMSRRQHQRNHRRIWRSLRGRERAEYLAHYARQRLLWTRSRLQDRLQLRFAWSQKPARREEIQAAAQRLATTQRCNRAATARYQVKAYGGNLTLFRAMLSFHAEHSLDLGWKAFAREVRVVEVAGNHISAIEPPHARLLARRFKHCLRQAQHLSEASNSSD